MIHSPRIAGASGCREREDAACSNREHDTAGLRRTNADKRWAVEMALEARPELSDRAIAEQVGVSAMTVGRIRPTCNIVTPDCRIGADGKSYPTSNGKPPRRVVFDEPEFDEADRISLSRPAPDEYWSPSELERRERAGA